MQYNVTFVIRNKIPAPCVICGANMNKLEGFASKDGRSWFSFCSSVHCIEEINGAKDLIEKKFESGGRRELIMEDDQLCVYTPYDPKIIPALRGMPGARWNKTKTCWTVSTDMKDRQRIFQVCENISVEVNENVAPPEVDVSHLDLDTRLFPFQVEGIKFIHNRDALLGDDQGLGKTVQVLSSIPKGGRAIVVCKKTLRGVWRDECNRWRPDLTPAIMDDIRRPPKANEIIICNYERMPGEAVKLEGKKVPLIKYDKELLEAFKNDAGYILVCDEAHYLKNRESQRHQRFKTLGTFADKVWLLTGTPLANRPFDLKGVLDAGGMFKEVFGSWNKFIELFGGYRDRWGGYKFNGPSTPEASERLRRVMIRRLKDDVLDDLPEKTYQKINVEIEDKALVALLDELYEEYAMFFYANELPPFEAFSKVRSLLAEYKGSIMGEIVEEYEESDVPLVVFSAHRKPVLELAERDGWVSIHGTTPSDKRDEYVRRFQAGELKGIALTIGAGAEGLTLTRAHNMMFVDIDWTPAKNYQAEDRIRRIGQKNACHYIHVMAEHPLEAHVFDLLEEKKELISKAIESEVHADAPELAVEMAIDHDETKEEWEARVGDFQAKQKERQRASVNGRVGKYHESLTNRYSISLPEEYDEELTKALHSAHAYMLSVCDGAIEDDFMGFNKPDSYIARTIYSFELDEDLHKRTLHLLLWKYKRQLGERFPELYNFQEKEQ